MNGYPPIGPDGKGLYYTPLQIPFNWRDEPSKVLQNAVWAYINYCAEPALHPEPSPEQTKLLIWFCGYFIEAPCWEDNLRECEEMLEELQELRRRAKTLASVESIRRWSVEAMELGLDPW